MQFDAHHNNTIVTTLDQEKRQATALAQYTISQMSSYDGPKYDFDVQQPTRRISNGQGIEQHFKWIFATISTMCQ